MERPDLMALSDDVQARFSDAELIQLTRSGQAGSTTTIDTTLLATVAGDVEALFPVYMGAAYDSTSSLHVALACEGVRAKLRSRTKDATGRTRSEWDQWKDDVREAAKIGPRARIAPATGSRYTASRPDDTNTVRPAFDDRDFEGYMGEPPPSDPDV